MNAPLVKPNPSRSAGSTAVLEYLASIWPLGACRAALSNVFEKADYKPGACTPLAKRVDKALASLVSSGQLSNQGSGKDRKWILGPAARLAGPQGPQEATAKQPADADVGARVEAAHHDVMTGPTYCPKPMQALRPGSDDFTRFPSLHRGQRIPFTGGYVSMTGGK